jgi:hypothetical protein
MSTKVSPGGCLLDSPESVAAHWDVTDGLCRPCRVWQVSQRPLGFRRKPGVGDKANHGVSKNNRLENRMGDDGSLVEGNLSSREGRDVAG